MGSKTNNLAILSVFQEFREELDRHHECRERIVKVSRDITALSKKMLVHFLGTFEQLTQDIS